MPTWELRVVGDPAPKGSWDIMPSNRGVTIRGERLYRIRDMHLEPQNGPKLARWTHAIELAVLEAGRPRKPIANAAVSVAGTFFLARPRTTKYPDAPLGPPDLDKLERALGDVLKRAGYYADDSQIVAWDIRKAWAVDTAGALITVTVGAPFDDQTTIDI